jgi:hypothetical protein
MILRLCLSSTPKGFCIRGTAEAASKKNVQTVYLVVVDYSLNRIL